MARQKKKVFANISLDAAEKASQEYAFAANKLQKIEAKMNDEINKVKAKYQEDISLHQASMEEPMEVLHAYANEEKESWGKKKSFEMLHTVIGFRTGTPKVIKMKGFTWDGVTEIVSRIFPNLIRVKKELDKEAIISLRNEDGINELRDKCFIDVVQDETFFVEPKLEELAAIS